MLCPRCRYELDANQSICVYCGFVILKSPSGNLPGEVPPIRQTGSLLGQQVSAHQISRRDLNAAPSQIAPFYFQPNEQHRYDQSPSQRTARFTTNLSTQGAAPRQTAALSSPSIELTTPVSSPLEADLSAEKDAFSPGSLLCQNRYRLIDKHEPQRWAHGAYETHWHAQDSLQRGAQVIVCEVKLPGMKVLAEQACLRTAMRAFSAADRLSHIPALIDVFRERERDFFVFQAIEGESLLARMQRSRQLLPEREAIEICLQLTETLEALAQQEPPLVHGLINPAHLVTTAYGQWLLTDFSIVLASGAQQYFSDLDPSLFSPFTAPEFTQGMIDSRADLYSLLATVYYGVSGELPKGQMLNARVSSSFNAIFMKGLQSSASQRYQQPAALRQELLALRSTDNMPISTDGQTRRSNTLVTGTRQRQRSSTSLSTNRLERITSTPTAPAWRQEEHNSIPRQRISQAKQPYAPVMQNALTSSAQPPSSLTAPGEPGVLETGLLPPPEALPPLRPRNDFLVATLWIVGTIIFALILVLLK